MPASGAGSQDSAASRHGVAIWPGSAGRPASQCVSRRRTAARGVWVRSNPSRSAYARIPTPIRTSGSTLKAWRHSRHMRTASPWRRSLPPCSADCAGRSLCRGSGLARDKPWGVVLVQRQTHGAGEGCQGPDIAALEKGGPKQVVIAARSWAELSGNHALACVQRRPSSRRALEFAERAVSPPLRVPYRSPTSPAR